MIPRRIVFCTDFSDNSVPARECALDFAGAFNAELLVLYVLDSSKAGSAAYKFEVPAETLEGLKKQLLEDANKGLEKEKRELAPKIDRISIHLREGVPSTEIVKFSRELSIDLIVLGTHGWTGLKHLIMGSTAENVVRMANCPVLTVKPPGVFEQFF